MTFVSYAQNFEDVMLWRALGHVRQGVYLDVGAAWPDEDSVTKAFYDRGWRGINVEPNPDFHKRLENERPDDTNLLMTVSDHVGSSSMSFFEGTGLSTLQESIAKQHAEEGLEIKRRGVLLTTLAAIIERYKPAGTEIHFLKVDVEGHETAVLRGNNWNRFRPWIVLVEATMPMSQVESYEEWEPILLSADYLFAYADGLNRFYVAREHSHLLSAFRFPPNVFDGFVQVNQQKTLILRAAAAERCAAEAKVTEHQTRILLLQSKESVAHLTAELRGSEESVAHLTAELRGMLTSKSWRMTAPLRWCATQLRRLKQDGLNNRSKALVKKIRHKFSKATKIDRFDGTRALTPRGLQIYEALKRATSQNNEVGR